MTNEVKIRNVTINPNLALAPMAGVTDSSFRRLIKELGGVGLIVTEFISVEGITRGNMRTHRMMKFLPEERPLSIQIFGYDDQRMVAAAEIIEESGADIVDINCGCPAPKVVKHGGGSGLLKDHTRLETILKEIKKAIKIPLTIKIRAGFYDHTINAVVSPFSRPAPSVGEADDLKIERQLIFVRSAERIGIDRSSAAREQRLLVSDAALTREGCKHIRQAVR